VAQPHHHENLSQRFWRESVNHFDNDWSKYDPNYGPLGRPPGKKVEQKKIKDRDLALSM
jgi:hypothetical protein